jgi:ABC-2 type transport system permease protein
MSKDKGSGNKVFIVARYEFLNTVKKKVFLLTVLFLPLLIVVPIFLSATFLPNAMNGAGQSTGFVDDTGLLMASKGYVKYPGIEQAKAALLNGNISAFFVVSDDYLATGNITRYSKGLSPNAGTGLDAFLTENLLRYAQVNDSVAKRITQPSLVSVVSLDDKGNPKEGGGDLTSFLQPYILSILLFLCIMTSSSYLMQGIGEEKENRTGELLLSSISADELLKGKIFGYGAVGLLQVGIWIAVGLLALTASQFAPLLAGIKITWIMGLAVVYFVLGYALFAASIACAAAISPTAKEAQQTSSIFTMLAALPMIFSQFIMFSPDSDIAKALTFFPYTAPVVTMMRISLVEIPLQEIAASIVILLVSIFLVMKLAGKIFRMGMLLQGKKPGLREIIRFAREK